MRGPGIGFAGFMSASSGDVDGCASIGITLVVHVR